MKKIFLSFILIICCVFLCGCGQSKGIKIDDNFIMLTIDTNSDGSVKQSIVFGVNSPFLQENSQNLQEVFQFKQNLQKNIEEIRNEFLFSFALIYMNNPIEEYKINQGVLLSQVGYNQEGDYLGFEITFTSSGAWKYYHQTSLGEEEKSNNGRGNVFISVQSSKGDFPFGETLKEKYKNIYLSSAKGFSFEGIVRESYNPDFVYNYCTYYPKFHSNATATFRGSDNKYHHVWINGGQIVISVYIINKGWWIFFTLLVSLSLMTIAIILTKRKSRHR